MHALIFVQSSTKLSLISIKQCVFCQFELNLEVATLFDRQLPMRDNKRVYKVCRGFDVSTSNLYPSPLRGSQHSFNSVLF